MLDDLMAERGEDKELLDLYTKHSHHQNITLLYLCQDVSTREIYQEYFQERPLHHSLQESRRSIRHEEIYCLKFPPCWEDMMDVYQIVTERPFGYMVLDLHAVSYGRKRVFSHLLTDEGYLHWHRRKREDV